MKTKYQNIKISDCQTLERNPQFLSEKIMLALKASIKKDGFLSPILVSPMKNKKFRIVSGNHRFLAAKELGLQEIPAVIRKLNEDDLKRLALNLNFIHGEPPIELIAPFLAELSEKSFKDLFLSEDLITDLKNFGVEIDKMLGGDIPGFVDKAPGNTQPTCKCPKCGKLHVRN